MLALFQCCGKPFFGTASQPSGVPGGPGFTQSIPIALRVRCPKCSRLAEARLDAPCTIAHILPSVREGMLALRGPHGGLLNPLQLTPDRRTEFPVEDDQILCRAWDLTVALTAASTAALPPRPGDLSPELTSAVIGHAYPDLQSRARSAAIHCSYANSSLEQPTCNWEPAPMAWKLAPPPTESSPFHPWHGLSRHA